MKRLFVIALSFLMFACSEESTELDETPKCTSSPTLTTNEVSNITDISVAFSGTIEAPTCDPSVTSQGFVYGLKTLPKISDEVIEVNDTIFSKEITGLQQNRTYYCRTYFTNPTGTYYGNQISFNTIDPLFFYLDANGITVKAKDGAETGSIGIINGVEYTIVDSNTLNQMIRNGDDVSTVCISRIVNMNEMFNGATTFNQDISAWDVSNVTDMKMVFSDATAFNQDLSAWDVSNVTDMRMVFSGATAFNQDLSAWDVSNVKSMTNMFSNATVFNQDISAWDVSNVTEMWGMFSSASAFNQDLRVWDVTKVVSRNDFDAETASWVLPRPNFISPIYIGENGTTVKVKEGTPTGAKGFLNGVEFTVVDLNTLRNMIRNGDDVTTVCTSTIKDMRQMFSSDDNFNQDISTWDVSNVTAMDYMFYDATSFNQDLSAWDVSNVKSYIRFYNNTPQWTLPKPYFK